MGAAFATAELQDEAGAYRHRTGQTEITPPIPTLIEIDGLVGPSVRRMTRTLLGRLRQLHQPVSAGAERGEHDNLRPISGKNACPPSTGVARLPR